MLPSNIMREYLCVKVELDAQSGAVNVSGERLRVSFGTDDPPNDLHHSYVHHRSVIHDAATPPRRHAATLRAASSMHRLVVL